MCAHACLHGHMRRWGPSCIQRSLQGCMDACVRAYVHAYRDVYLHACLPIWIPAKMGAGLDPCPTTFITTFLPIDLSSLIHIALTADLRLSISTDIHTFMATRILDAQRRARGSRSPFTYRHPYRHAYRKGLSKSTSGAWSTPRGVDHHPYLIPYNSRSAPYGNPQGRGRGQSRKVSPRSAAADLKTPPRRSTRHQ